MAEISTVKGKMPKKKNSLVFIDVCIDGDPLERMIFELFTDDVPKTAENFRALCTGENGIGPSLGKPLHYKGTFFHRIVKGSMAQGGDLLRQEGSAGESIYGDRFPDESSKRKHDEAGLLSMSVADRDTRGSIFYLLFEPNQNLDRKNIVFGKLVHGLEILKKIENAGDEEGRPTVTVKIVNCGELSENDKKKLIKKLGKETSLHVYGHESRRKGKRKKSSRNRRKRRRKHYSSESESLSSDSETDSTESDTDSESDSSSDISLSSNDRRKKRKRMRRDKHRRGRKRRDRRHERKRRKRNKHSKHKSKRALDSQSDTDSGSETGSSSADEINAKDLNQDHDLQKTVENHSPLLENVISANNHKGIEYSEKFDDGESRISRENGQQHLNDIERDARTGISEDRQPDVLEDHPDRSASPKRAMSKSMSISPRSRHSSRSPMRRGSRSPGSPGKSPTRGPTKSPTRGPTKSPTRGPSRSPTRNPSRSPARNWSRSHSRSLSRSPAMSLSKSPARSLSRSPSRIPVRSPSRSLSRSPPRSHSRRKVSVNPIKSPPRRSPSGSFGRASSRRSIGRSPVRSSHRSISRSSGRAASRRVASRSPLRSPPGRSYRRSYSRSPVGRSPVRRSPPSTRRRSLSRSGSPDGSPNKRIRRGRGFSDRYAYARKYRTPTPDRYRYGGRDRRYADRSPRRYRSPRRSPPRYRSRRSRTRSPSVSRSPPVRRRRYSRSHSPVHPPRYLASPRTDKRHSVSSHSRSRSPSVSPSGSSRGSPPPKKVTRAQSRSSSDSPPGRNGLVSYGDGSPEASPRL